MRAAFQGSFTRAAGSVLREPDAKALMRRAHPKYREILARVTEFDKSDRFLVNILSCAMLSAVLLSTERRYDVKTVRRFYSEAMRENAFMRFAAAHSDHYTEKGSRKLKERAARSQTCTNPYSWKFTVEDGETIDQYTATFTVCGICRLMTELGLADQIPAMCALDYDMAEMGDTVFTRQYTLAFGGPYRDCHYDRRPRKRTSKHKRNGSTCVRHNSKNNICLLWAWAPSMPASFSR